MCLQLFKHVSTKGQIQDLLFAQIASTRLKSCVILKLIRIGVKSDKMYWIQFYHNMIVLHIDQLSLLISSLI